MIRTMVLGLACVDFIETPFPGSACDDHDHFVRFHQHRSSHLPFMGCMSVFVLCFFFDCTRKRSRLCRTIRDDCPFEKISLKRTAIRGRTL